MDSVIKIFQRKDGSLIYFASTVPNRDAVYQIRQILKSVLGENDKAVIGFRTDFQFFNISDSQLKEMEIKPENPEQFMKWSEFQNKFHDAHNNRMIKYGEAKMLLVFISIRWWYDLMSCDEAKLQFRSSVNKNEINGIETHLVIDDGVLEFKFKE